MENDRKKAPKAFKDIVVRKEKVKLGLPDEEIRAWQKAREEKATRVIGKATATIKIGWPEDTEPKQVPVLAAAEFDDRWEILALYGSTHRLSKDEIASVDVANAA